MVDNDAKVVVALTLSCGNLPDLDTFSKSDPFVVVSMREASGRPWRTIGRTEVINDNLDPHFSTRFTVDYFFEKLQELKFMVYDSDGKGQNLNNHDFMGEVVCTLGNVVSSPGSTYQTQLRKKNKDVRGHKRSSPAMIFVHAEQLGNDNEYVNFQIIGRKLKKMDFFGKSDPYLEFFRQIGERKSHQTHRTEVIDSNLNPVWRAFTIKCSTLSGADAKAPILVKCWDHNRRGGPDFIGQFTTTLAELKDPRGQRSYTLALPKKPNKSRGTIEFKSVQFYKEHTWMDFLQGGLQISLSIAIDLTGSNGDPRRPGSLHYQANQAANQYVQAIKSIGNILSPYDHDGTYPVWGFGGKYVGSDPRVGRRGMVNHCMNLNLTDNPEVVGLDGVLMAYSNLFRSNCVQLSGPTWFSEVIGTATALASTQPFNSDEQCYSILLIITDGVINDQVQTINSIVAASRLPISIIIVGVGDADFSQMDMLDGDTHALRSSDGTVAARDIVQFVPFREFKNDPSALAQHTLEEVPGQVLKFAKMFKVNPLPTREFKAEDLLVRNASMMGGMDQKGPPGFQQGPQGGGLQVPNQQFGNALAPPGGGRGFNQAMGGGGGGGFFNRGGGMGRPQGPQGYTQGPPQGQQGQQGPPQGGGFFNRSQQQFGAPPQQYGAPPQQYGGAPPQQQGGPPSFQPQQYQQQGPGQPPSQQRPSQGGGFFARGPPQQQQRGPPQQQQQQGPPPQQQQQQGPPPSFQAQGPPAFNGPQAI